MYGYATEMEISESMSEPMFSEEESESEYPEVNGIQYLISDSEVTVMGYIGDEKSLVVPAEIESYPVTDIGEGAFSDLEELENVILPDSVKNISDHAFNCSRHITNITLGNGLETLQRSVFLNCHSLESVTLPASFKGFNSDSFFNRSTKSIFVAPDNTNFASVDGVLFDKSETELLIMPSGRSGRYNISTNIQNIKEFAFDRAMGVYAIDVDTNHTKYASIDGSLYNKEKTTLLVCPKIKIDEYVIPDNTKVIGKRAFYYCLSYLNNVVIPDSVVTIEQFAFAHCIRMTNIVMGNGVEKIELAAFYECRGLSEIVIPDRVKVIDTLTFGECPDLSSVTIGKGVERIEDRAFYSCWSLEEITIPDNVTTLGEGVFYECVSLREITIGKGVKKMGPGIFEECPSLRKILFLGDAPECENPFGDALPRGVTIYYMAGTTGWGDSWAGVPTKEWK
jgi:hypothetical protein